MSLVILVHPQPPQLLQIPPHRLRRTLPDDFWFQYDDFAVAQRLAKLRKRAMAAVTAAPAIPIRRSRDIAGRGFRCRLSVSIESSFAIATFSNNFSMIFAEGRTPITRFRHRNDHSISSCLRIRRQRDSLISGWRGTGAFFPLRVFTNISCFLPWRFRMQPAATSSRIKFPRFYRPRRRFPSIQRPRN